MLQIQNVFQKNLLLNFVSLNVNSQSAIYPTPLQLCQATADDNCSIFESSSICSKCKSNYYLENGKCFKNPTSSIKNCKVYSSASVCVQCLPDFYLSSSTICSPVDKTIESQCLVYDSTANRTLCLSCKLDYFLLSENKC